MKFDLKNMSRKELEKQSPRQNTRTPRINPKRGQAKAASPIGLKRMWLPANHQTAWRSKNHYSSSLITNSS